MTTFQFSTATHVGRVRTTNEDRLLAQPDHGVWLVADGMGGHEAGDFAAQTIVDAAAGMPTCKTFAEQAKVLRQSIFQAHDSIRRATVARGNGPIGATVAAFLMKDQKFQCFWAGDSRLYRLRDDTLKMVTTDHSVVADLVQLGELSWEDARHHPQSNVITRAVGAYRSLELDVCEGSVQPGDRFLLCTDGLNTTVDHEALHATLSDTPLPEAADKLVKLALAGGGSDNVTVIVLDVTG